MRIKMHKTGKNELLTNLEPFPTCVSQVSESLSTVGVDNFVDKIRKQVKNALNATN